MLVYYVALFIFGLFLGSFLNLVGDRIVNGGSIVTGRSKCDGCGMTLQPKHLVPVLSYVFQNGKCPNCDMKLSLTYPLAEVLTGLSLLFSALVSGVFEVGSTRGEYVMFIYLAVVLSVYVILFMTDLKYQLIPNGVVFFGIIFAFVFSLGFQLSSLVTLRRSINENEFGKYLIEAGFMRLQYSRILKLILKLWISTLILAGFFQFLIVVTKGRGMGGGDVKLALLIGLFNGYPNNVLAVFFGFVLGAVYSLFLMAFHKKGMKDTIAFGPFLIVGSILAYVWGSAFLDWYLNIGF